jgi:hypothetical protein
MHNCVGLNILVLLLYKIDDLSEVLEGEVFCQDCEEMDAMVVEIFDLLAIFKINVCFLGKPGHRIPYHFF